MGGHLTREQDPEIEHLEFGRLVLELFRGKVTSWAARGAQIYRLLCDVSRPTTRPRVLPFGCVPSDPAGATRDRELDNEQTEGQPGAHDVGKPLGQQTRKRWRGGY